MSNFGPNSVGSDPFTTSQQSPDTLPLVGFSVDQLAAYILRTLGGSGAYNVEISKQNVLDQIQDALGLFSQWVPQIKARAITLVRGQFSYLVNEPVGQGIVDVSFVEYRNQLTQLLYLGMISPAPLPMSGISEFDSWLRFKSTFMRVSSVRPDWHYDDEFSTLYVYNPLAQYRAGVFIYDNYTDTRDLTSVGALWVKEYALESSRFLLGTLNQKFSGAIPSPLQNLQLDQNLRVNAQTAMDKLRASLVGMMRSSPASTDA